MFERKKRSNVECDEGVFELWKRTLIYNTEFFSSELYPGLWLSM